MCVTAVKRLKRFLVLFTRCSECFLVQFYPYFPLFQTSYRTFPYPKQRKIYIKPRILNHNIICMLVHKSGRRFRIPTVSFRC